jgi:hypothetical protein
MNVFCQGGWEEILNGMVSANLLKRMRLFQNNHTPVNSDTYASYTEATFSGYSGYQNIVWGSAFINGSTQGEIDATQLTWTHNGGGTANTIYGVYITDASDNLLYAERFPAPLTLASSGDAVPYTASVVLQDM